MPQAHERHDSRSAGLLSPLVLILLFLVANASHGAEFQSSWQWFGDSDSLGGELGRGQPGVAERRYGAHAL